MPDLPATVQNRRERQTTDRADEILGVAARLFAERGFHRTTTKDIAEAAGVAEGTLYNYFDSKDALLFGILGRLGETPEEELGLAGPPQADARQYFTTLLQRRRSYLDKNFVMVQAIMSEILANASLRERYHKQILDPWLEAIETALRQRIELGQIRPLDVPAAARFIASLWMGLFIIEAMGDPLIHIEWERLVETCASMIMDSVTP